MKTLLSTILTGIIFAGCAKPQIINEKEIRVRYVNLRLVFEFMANNDLDAKKLDLEKKETLSIIEKLEKESGSTTDETRRKILPQDIERYKAAIKKITTNQEYHKQKILSEINRVIGTVASRMQVDFVLNTGDTLIYFNKNFDITEDVLRELVTQKKRNAPVSR
jgi:Skp family chaperone for outer membrane proteins